MLRCTRNWHSSTGTTAHGPVSLLAILEAQYGSVDAAPGVEPLDTLVTRSTTKLEVSESFDTLVVVAHDAVNRAILAHLRINTHHDEEISQRTGCWNQLDQRDDGWHATIIDAKPGATRDSATGDGPPRPDHGPTQ